MAGRGRLGVRDILGALGLGCIALGVALEASALTGPNESDGRRSDGRLGHSGAVHPATVRLELQALEADLIWALRRRSDDAEGCLPDTLDEAAMLVDAWVLTDAWGQLYELYWTFDEAGDAVAVVSLGPDGELGSADDIWGATLTPGLCARSD